MRAQNIIKYEHNTYWNDNILKQMGNSLQFKN